jgi:DNA-binding XRE family transcriptional regulator
MRRVFLSLRQRDVAELSGVSREQIIRLELGECRPTWDTAVKLGRALVCDPADLFPDVTA